MFKPISEQTLKEYGIKEKPECVKIQYTYLRDDSIKPTIDCWLPPKGWIYDYFNERWIKIGVERRGKTDAECYWQIDPRFEEYRTWERWEIAQDEERAKLEKHLTETPKEEDRYQHPEINKTHTEFKHLKIKDDVEEFKRYCWLRRLGGHWYRNGNRDEYITGEHWYYLSVYKLDIGSPKYRKIDRDFFYHWQYCCEDPQCFGLNLITKRRGGKTYIGGAINLERTTRQDQYHAGIQSKTEDDARRVFKKAIISPFKKFPYFFKPISNLPKGGAIPASGLFFNSGKMNNDGNELESWIDFKASNVMAYDGDKLNYGFFDEEGKTIEVSVYDRWNVVKFCFLDDEGNIIGKSLHTTTVEDMDSGGKPFFNLWKDSDQGAKKGKRTVSGLHKHFIPAYKTRRIDKYGGCDEEANKVEILEELELLKNNPRAYSSAKRKEPFCEEDAFQMDAEECIYDFDKINARIEELRWIAPQYKVGNFHWKDGVENGEVIFVENPNGKFMVMNEPPPEKRNLFTKRGEKYFAGNVDMYCGGVDPYEYDMLTEESQKKMSYGAICVIKKEDPFNPSNVDGSVACLYIHRSTPKAFYEDVLLCMRYYGCMMLVEYNKSKIMDYLEEKGYEGYVPFLPGNKKRGIYAMSGTSDKIASLTDQFITEKCDKIYYMQLLEQWLVFNPRDTTKYDAAMAFGYAEMLRTNAISRTERKEELTDISELFSFMRKKSIAANRHG